MYPIEQRGTTKDNAVNKIDIDDLQQELAEAKENLQYYIEAYKGLREKAIRKIDKLGEKVDAIGYRVDNHVMMHGLPNPEIMEQPKPKRRAPYGQPVAQPVVEFHEVHPWQLAQAQEAEVRAVGAGVGEQFVDYVQRIENERRMQEQLNRFLAGPPAQPELDWQVNPFQPVPEDERPF